MLDEAQDFGEIWWPALTACLRDPERGGLAVFLDGRSGCSPDAGEPPALPLFDLDENLGTRSSIAQVFASLDSERQLRFRGRRAPPVRLVDGPEEQAQDRADTPWCGCSTKGGPLRTSPCSPRTTGTRCTRSGSTAGVTRPTGTSFFTDAEDVFYGHVLGFKGLERQVVVLAVDGFRDVGRARELLYVGLSRARALLVLVGDRERLVAVGGEGLRQRLERDVQPWPVE